MTEKLLKIWLVAVGGLLLLAVSDVSTNPSRPLVDLYFVQDLPILVGVAGVAGLATLWRIFPGAIGRWAAALPGFLGGRRSAFDRLRDRPLAVLAAVAAACAVIAYAGAYWVFEGHLLSPEEYVAVFDARIFAHGAPLGSIAQAWRPYAAALQPAYVINVPGGGYWASCYLPVNAILVALARAAGDRALLGPALAAISVVAVFAVARRLWPERPGTAWVAVILLATSSQFLVTAMTAFPMSAHLAFNLVWLWLFLRGGRFGNAGAIAVGFLACGLHQLVFHPLFAAPFILQLWLERRWPRATLYTAAYAAISLFWVEYPSLASAWVGVPVMNAHTAAVGGFAGQVTDLLGAFDFANIGMMAKNLIRFVTWQNPLMAPLAVLGAIAAFRARGVMRSLALGLGLTILVVFVVQPFQGYGWGYRYLHGLLGSAVLLAAWRWGQFTDALAAAEKATARLAFSAVATASLLALLPIRAWQAHQYVHPYAMADAAIRRSGAQLVLLDGAGSWFDWTLVRNDPDLTNRPLVLYLGGAMPGGLDPTQVKALCARYSTAVFDQTDAARFGIRTYAAPARYTRAALSQLGCAVSTLR